jgi:transcriptional regulator with XRE-family HTH domain
LRRGIPLAHLADRAGIGRTTMFRLLDASERKPSDPRLSTLAALAAALEVETFDLLMEHDEGR